MARTTKPKAASSLDPEQLACISRLAQLFPAGYLFCTPIFLGSLGALIMVLRS